MLVFDYLFINVETKPRNWKFLVSRDTWTLYWLVPYRLDTGQDITKIFWCFKYKVPKKVDEAKATFNFS